MTIRSPLHLGSREAAGLILPLAAALLYEAAARFGIFEARLLPPPSRIAETLWSLALTGELWTHVVATLLRLAAGFLIGSIVGILLGALTGAWPTASRLLDPTVQALRAIPSLAWVPLFILWLGIFEASKVALIAIGVFFPVYLGVMAAITNIDRKIVEVGRAFRLPPLVLTRRVLLPAVLPDCVIAVRSGLGLGFMFVVAAELMGASEGLGFLLLDGQQLGKPDQILAAILAFAVLGKICDGALVAAFRPLLRWQDTLGQSVSRSAAAPAAAPPVPAH
ncbi:MAG: ABC transporter permease [Methylobacteriaceae bacterium]|nr:ABC transporter permease [Methylobacteriaceae bacterium]MBV9395956.1 ABC transporter permease [Methylobacteriaceae bacterium]